LLRGRFFLNNLDIHNSFPIISRAITILWMCEVPS
jgi:hypothetical protein